MATYGFYCGTQSTAQTTGAYANSTCNNFSWYDTEGSGYNKGPITINAATVSTIPGSTVSSNTANGAPTGCGIVDQDGGSQVNVVASGHAFLLNGGNGWPHPASNVGAIDFDLWASNYNNDWGNFQATVGECADVGGTDQGRPGNQHTDAERYNILMPSGLSTGESSATKTGRRAIYRCAAGQLAATLAKVCPLPGAGFPPVTFGRILSNQNDTQAAVVWLAFGYGILQGTSPFCWTV